MTPEEQFQFLDQSNPATFEASVAESFDPTFLISTGVVVGLLVAALYIARWLITYWHRQHYVFERTVFQILMPKEPQEQADKDDAIQKKDFREVIAEMESLYANLMGLRRLRGWVEPWHKLKKFFKGSHRHLALEIVAHDGLIKFYLAVRKDLAEYVEQQILAIYPEAELKIVEDYNIFAAIGDVKGSYLTPSRDVILPLKTFKKMDGDPLDGLTNNLSKLANDEGAAIQILLRPAKSSWRSQALKISKELHQGKNFEQAVKTRSGLAGALNSLLSVPVKALQYLGHDLLTTKPSDLNDPHKQNAEDKNRNAPVRLQKREEDLLQSLEEKFSKNYFECNIRLVASAKTPERSRQLLGGLVGSFSQFTSSTIGNALREKPLWRPRRFINDFIYRNFRDSRTVILSTEELASLYHFPLPTTETPNILWLSARTLPPPVNLPSTGLLLGKTNFRGSERLVKIQTDDRRRHVYIIGKSGTGKSALLYSMAVQDIKDGHGVCVVDPHGDLIENILSHIPANRADDVIVFDPSDISRPVGLNMLEAHSEEEKDFAVQEMISIFYKLFPPEMIGPMFEHNMRNVMLTLMSDTKNPGTIAEIPRMFTDNDFQKSWVNKLKDPIVRSFWEKEMAKTSDFHKSEMLGYLVSKVGRFVENEMIRNIIGQTHSGFDLRQVMDDKKVLLVNLSKGRVGEVNSNLLGLIIVSKLQMAALGRADLPEDKRNDFYLYIDEFQNFITPSIATILSEARKYRLNLIIAHQYLGQLSGGSGVSDKSGDTQIRDAVLGTTGTLIAFKIGAEDAEILAKEFSPTVNQFDLVNVEKFHAYIKLLVDNQATRPFTMATIWPGDGNKVLAGKIKELSRLKYGRDRNVVQQEILQRTQLGQATAQAQTEVSEPSR